MIWLKRIGLWLVVALGALLPAWGWLRERRARKAAELRWHEEVARGQREAALERERRTIEANTAKAETAIAVRVEAAAAVHEARAVDAIKLEGDLDELAAALMRTAKPRRDP